RTQRPILLHRPGPSSGDGGDSAPLAGRLARPARAPGIALLFGVAPCFQTAGPPHSALTGSDRAPECFDSHGRARRTLALAVEHSHLSSGTWRSPLGYAPLPSSELSTRSEPRSAPLSA